MTLKMEMKKEVKMEVARGRWREEGGARKATAVMAMHMR